MKSDTVPLDYRVITALIEPRAKVLDLGCGTGELMFFLRQQKQARVQGIEIDAQAIYRCVEKGLSVFQGDIDRGLAEYPDQSFDCVILNQSMQQVKKAEFVIEEALRVGRQLIVGFPNFAYWTARVRLGLLGRAPVTASLPHRWVDSPNVRFFSIRDFERYCALKQIVVCGKIFLSPRRIIRFLPNLLALNAVYCLQRR